MKILSFGGGLGNQIFCYAFYLYMKEKYHQEQIYGYYNTNALSEHHGLEIDKWFDVQLPTQKWYATLVLGILYLLKKIIGNHKWVDTSTRECYNENAIAFVAYKYTKIYLPKYEWIKWKFNEEHLSDRNRELLSFIRSSNAWFIHVRRGDYLSPKYKELFEGCCTLSYYEQAITDVLSKNPDAKFLCFSDDIDWAKENLPDVIDYFPDWNTGEKSPIDMFLMSQCKGAIIANSTFSYWGAVLGIKKSKVYYPQKWINSKRGIPNIFFDEWIPL